MEVIKIKDLPELDRPREKALHYGINKLSNIEILALIIGSGGKDNNVLMIASSLLAKAHSINNLINFSFNDFLSVPGIKKAMAFRFIAISELIKRQGLSHQINTFIDSKNIARRYCYIIGNNQNESMYLIGISKKGNIKFEKELYVGTRHSLVSSELEIINELIKQEASNFILVHNHPSQNIAPSEEDIISTKHLLLKAKDNNLTLLDHIVVGNHFNYFSFKEHSLLNT